VLLLHGLAGHADEWAQTASWLTARCRVVALDARGHGRTERLPDDVSRDALVGDAAFLVERLSLQPVVVVGQSVGGLTAMSVAARHPDLVRGVVLVDASPTHGGEEVEKAVAAIADALRGWPVSLRVRRRMHSLLSSSALASQPRRGRVGLRTSRTVGGRDSTLK
jgi:pimeloyl-ACP methyl ester carboxylesterase